MAIAVIRNNVVFHYITLFDRKELEIELLLLDQKWDYINYLKHILGSFSSNTFEDNASKETW